MMGALCGAMFAAVREYSRHGQHVVLDVALTNPQARKLLVDYLEGWSVYLVGVSCSLQELARRERLRGDRSAGLAASQVDWLHRRMCYDFQVDTTGKTPEEAAAELLAWFESPPAPTALGKVRALQAVS